MKQVRRFLLIFIFCSFCYIFVFSSPDSNRNARSDCLHEVMDEAKKCERALLRLHDDLTSGCPPTVLCDNCTKIHASCLTEQERLSKDLSRVEGDKAALDQLIEVILPITYINLQVASKKLLDAEVAMSGSCEDVDCKVGKCFEKSCYCSPGWYGESCDKEIAVCSATGNTPQKTATQNCTNECRDQITGERFGTCFNNECFCFQNNWNQPRNGEDCSQGTNKKFSDLIVSKCWNVPKIARSMGSVSKENVTANMVILARLVLRVRPQVQIH
jgi:hypothetical protein